MTLQGYLAQSCNRGHIHIYIYIYTHTHTHTHTHTQIHIYTHTHTHTQIHIYTHTHKYIYTHTHTHTQIHTHTFAYILPIEPQCLIVVWPGVCPRFGSRCTNVVVFTKAYEDDISSHG